MRAAGAKIFRFISENMPEKAKIDQKMLNIIILKEKRTAGEIFLVFPYENHLTTLKIDIFM